MGFNKQKFTIALICTAIGWFVGYEMGKFHERKDLRQKSRNVFDIVPHMFFSPLDTFNNDESGEQDEAAWWHRFFPAPEKFRGKIIDNGMSIFGGGDTGDFKTRDDEHFVYYEYEMENVSKDSLSVRVENHMVIIEGSETKQAFGATVSTSFHRAFPAPENVDVDKVQMDYIEKKLIIKFPKIGK
jgi:HSP20 family molecular chaperone IbpA